MSLEALEVLCSDKTLEAVERICDEVELLRFEKTKARSEKKELLAEIAKLKADRDKRLHHSLARELLKEVELLQDEWNKAKSDNRRMSCPLCAHIWT